MGKLYIVGRGHLKDDSGKEFHKGTVIDIDNFVYLHDRVKSFVKNGNLLIPGKIKKEPSQFEIEKQDIEKKINELNSLKKDIEIEKKDFQIIKEKFYKEVDIYNEKIKKFEIEKENLFTEKEKLEKLSKKFDKKKKGD